MGQLCICVLANTAPFAVYISSVHHIVHQYSRKQCWVFVRADGYDLKKFIVRHVTHLLPTCEIRMSATLLTA